MATNIQKPRGTMDILPQNSYKWQYVEEQLELIDSAVCNIYSENREDCHSVGIFSECNNAQEAIINIRKRF